MFRWLLPLLLTLILAACDSPSDTAPGSTSSGTTTSVQTTDKATLPAFEPLSQSILLNEPTQLHRFETTTEAMTVWRRGNKEQPTLLLLSNNPHLTPVPEPFLKKALILANNASQDNLRLAAASTNPSPALLPSMAVDIALRSGWFREVAWALPIRDPAEELNLERFQSQLTSSGIATEDEAQTLTLNDNLFTGSLRGVPFRAAALPLLKLKDPVIVHIDLSYFQPLYKNEIATPLLDIIFQTIQTLKKMHLETLAVTFSYGHTDSQIALDVRFLGEVISYLIEDPARLDQDIPKNWQRQRDTLYLANFFQKDKVRELFLAQEQDEPDAAYVKFNLYRSAASHKEGNKALDYLAQAVALEPIYALEYFELSNMAYEKQRPDEALRMLSMAKDVFHEDPFLKLQMVELANELGQKEMAMELLNKIRNLEWSKTYYPDMPQYLTDLTTHVQSGKRPELSGSMKEGHEQKDIELIIPKSE